MQHAQSGKLVSGQHLQAKEHDAGWRAARSASGLAVETVAADVGYGSVQAACWQGLAGLQPLLAPAVVGNDSVTPTAMDLAPHLF